MLGATVTEIAAVDLPPDFVALDFTYDDDSLTVVFGRPGDFPERLPTP